jgi:hypothetical protein
MPKRRRAAAARLVFTSPALRIPMLLGWLAAFYNIPGGVRSRRPWAAGRWPSDSSWRPRLRCDGRSDCLQPVRRPGEAGAVDEPAGCGGVRRPRPVRFPAPLPIALMVLAVSGLFDCYIACANACLSAATPARQRSQAFGTLQGGMSLGQGGAIVVAGAAAERLAPNLVIAASGAVGAVAAIAIAVSRSRARPDLSQPRVARTGQPQVVPRIAGAPSSGGWPAAWCRSAQVVPRIAGAPSSGGWPVAVPGQPQVVPRISVSFLAGV